MTFSIKLRDVTSLILLLATFTKAQDDFKTSCSGSSGILKYKVGKTYVYKYNSNGTVNLEEILMGQGVEPAASINTQGVVQLTPLTECEFVLTIQDFKISLVNYNSEGIAESMKEVLSVEKSSIEFTTLNGVLEGYRYALEVDQLWTINLKKAIATMFTNPLFSSTFDKSSILLKSIYGNCQTDVMLENGVYTQNIHLGQCDDGESSTLISQGAPYDTGFGNNKGIYGSIFPMRMASLNQTLTSDNIIGVSEWLENNGDIPQNMDRRRKSKLEFVSEGEKTLSDEERKTLRTNTDVMFIFDDSVSDEISAQAEKEAHRILSEITRENVAESFIVLKRSLRRIKNSLEAYDAVLDSDLKKKTFYDALCEVSTDEAIKALAKYHTEGKLDPRTKLGFYVAAAFAKKPNVGALDAMTGLVKQLSHTNSGKYTNARLNMHEFKEKQSLEVHLILGASGLAHQYCQMTEGACENIPSYVALIDAIAEHVQDGVDEEIMLAALHALGNVEILTPSAVEAVGKIFKNSNSPQWMVIQSLDAFRRNPCQKELKATAKTIMNDQAKTDQLRMHAYLAISRCINQEDVTDINNVLLEDNSPVGGFIASHIRNIMDSSSPSKNTLKYSSLNQVVIPHNVRPVHNETRASRFFEQSSFNEKDNLGFSGEFMMIFSPGKITPEFVSFNGTVDVYGKSFNFLEIGLSQRFLPSTMMYHDDSQPADWYSLTRAVAAKDSYYRIFGTTIGLGLEHLSKAIHSSVAFNSEGSMTLNLIQPMSFIDETVIFPTLTGLPLTIDLQAVRFETMKLEFIQESKQTSDFDVKISLSADNNIGAKGTVGLGAGTPVHIGYSGEINVNHRADLGVEAKKEDGKTELRLNFPKREISRKDIGIDIYAFQEIQGKFIPTRDLNTQGIEMVGSSLVSQPRECSNALNVIGLRTCHQMRKGNKYPILFSCVLEKEEESMQAISIQVSQTGSDVNPNYDIVLTTPGAETQRSLTAQLKTESGNDMQPGYWQAVDVTLEASRKDHKFTGHLFANRSESMWRSFHDYDILIEYATPKSKGAFTTLAAISIIQPYNDGLTCTANFGGFLQYLGNMKYEMDIQRKTNKELRTNSFHIKKSLSWNSSILGENNFEFQHGYEFKDDRQYSALSTLNVKFNKEMYGVSLTSSDRPVWKEVENNWDGQVERYNVTVESVKSHRLEVYHNDVPIHSAELETGWAFIPQEAYRQNISISIQSNQLPSPLRLEGSMIDWHKNHSSDFRIAVIEEGAPRLNASLVTQYNFKESRHYHWHIDVIHFPSGVEVISDIDTIDSGTVFTATTATTVKDARHNSTVTSNSQWTFDNPKRTFDLKSKAFENGRLVHKFHLNGHIASNVLNGSSYATMELEGEDGIKATGSLKENCVSSYKYLDPNFGSRPKFLNSNFGLKFQSKGTKPFTYDWHYVFTDHKSDESKLLVDTEIKSDHHLTGVFMAPFDVLINKHIIYRMPNSQQIEIQSKTNVTSNGKRQQTSSFDIAVSTEDPKWTNINALLTGFTQDELKKYDMIMGFKSVGKVEDGPVIQNMTFKVIQTDEKGVSRDFLVGAINKSMDIRSLAEFEFGESGHVQVGPVPQQPMHKYDWIQLIRMHENELIIFKQIEETTGEGKAETKLLVDLSAKVFEENHQTKMSFNSRHNLDPNCPTSNFTLTLSK